MPERLQKLLSLAGIASRRHAETLILAGRVKVNGRLAVLGQRADLSIDRVEVDGKVVRPPENFLYYVMHKPVGYVSENLDSQEKNHGSVSQRDITVNRGRSAAPGSPTVRDLLPSELRGKVFSVGRLDRDSGGLLLFTNNGELAYRLTHPKFPHEKEYDVTVEKPIPSALLNRLRTGVTLERVLTKPARIKRLAPNRFLIAISEGRNRQIRRMCEAVGHSVTALSRVRILTLTDVSLKPGRVRALTPAEISALLTAVGLS